MALSAYRARATACAGVGLLLAAPVPSHGELALGAGYVGEHTDNARRTQDSRLEEWDNVWLAGLTYRDRGTDLAASVALQVEHHDYTQGIYEDETLGRGSAAVVWTLRPQRLTWTLVDRLEQLSREPTEPDIPSNRDTINVLDTGPDLMIPLDAVNTLVLGARVGNTWFKTEFTDNDHALVLLKFRHRLSPLVDLSLNADEKKVNYTELPAVTTLESYRRTDGYLRYDYRYTQNRLVIDAGRTWIVTDDTGQEISEWTGRLNLVRRLTAATSLGVSMGHELSTAGAALLAAVADPGLPDPIVTTPIATNDTATDEIYLVQRGEIYMNRTGRLLGVQAGVYGRRHEYIVAPEIRTENGARTNFSYNFTATLAARLYGNVLRTEYDSIQRLDRDVSYGARLGYRLNPHITFAIEGMHYDRNSSDSSGSYTENRWLLWLSYSTHPQLAPLRR